MVSHLPLQAFSQGATPYLLKLNLIVIFSKVCILEVREESFVSGFENKGLLFL